MPQKYSKSNNILILGFIILIKISIMIIAFFSAISYSVLYLILPSSIAILFDRNNDKCLFISIAFFNLSGILLTIPRPIIKEELDISSIFVIISKSITSIYVFSALGLLSYFIIPLLLKVYRLQSVKMKKSRSMAEIKRISKSWSVNS